MNETGWNIILTEGVLVCFYMKESVNVDFDVCFLGLLIRTLCLNSSFYFCFCAMSCLFLEIRIVKLFIREKRRDNSCLMV